MLDAEEFSLACYLVKLKLDGNELPATLPQHLMPPSKREGGHADTAVEATPDADTNQNQNSVYPHRDADF